MFNFTLTKTQIICLQLGLSEFGLKPAEWRIIKKSKSKFVIENATENNFYFVGEVQNKNTKKWRYIQLAGI